MNRALEDLDVLGYLSGRDEELAAGQPHHLSADRKLFAQDLTALRQRLLRR